PVDEVEEHELAHLPAGHHPPGNASRLSALATRFQRLALGADRRYLLPVREALRKRHGGPAYPAAASEPSPAWAGTTQRTQQRFRVRRAVTTSPWVRPA